jgi:GNAT superfamily N-acetyltransferase
VHSRVIPVVDDQPVWSVACFVVRPGHRGQGVASALLTGAVDFARAEGATILEGYPANNAGARLSSAFAYTGTRTQFEKAGFAKVADTTSRTGGVLRVVMRRALNER